MYVWLVGIFRIQQLGEAYPINRAVYDVKSALYIVSGGQNPSLKYTYCTSRKAQLKSLTNLEPAGVTEKLIGNINEMLTAVKIQMQLIL